MEGGHQLVMTVLISGRWAHLMLRHDSWRGLQKKTVPGSAKGAWIVSVWLMVYEIYTRTLNTPIRSVFGSLHRPLRRQ